MILEKLSLINYKNIAAADLELSPKMNCLVGHNGVGKTNVLDAVYFLSFCRSATNPVDSQVIRHEQEFTVMEGVYGRGTRNEDRRNEERGTRNEEGGTRKKERGARKVQKLGVHIRRGDYRQWHGGRYFFTDEQYLSVIRRFLTLHQDQPVQVFICGNDPSLHRERFQQALEGCSVVFPMGNPAEDMCLLSECDYLIGPPSTFTLVASMYHDRPLYWITDPEAPVTEESFGRFDDLFRYTL